MIIANATGCSSIWGGSCPSNPYTVNKEGKGPVWANSLFEDNASSVLVCYLLRNTLRGRVIDAVKKLKQLQSLKLRLLSLSTLIPRILQHLMRLLQRSLLLLFLHVTAIMKTRNTSLINKDFLSKKSQWIFGGDGWSYDIGFGGVGPCLAQNKDLNILIFDTEVYSNTGGQSSKSTPTGAIAQFAAAGKETKKKDLAAIAMSYGYIYVAQVAMG